MAAPFKNKNAVGNIGGTGAPLGVDRERAKKLRNLAIDEMIALFEMPKVKMKTDDYELYKAVLIKLAGSVLPRLNEHTGNDGEQLFPNPILNALFNNNRNKKNNGIEEKNTDNSGRDVGQQNGVNYPILDTLGAK